MAGLDTMDAGAMLLMVEKILTFPRKA